MKLITIIQKDGLTYSTSSFINEKISIGSYIKSLIEKFNSVNISMKII